MLIGIHLESMNDVQAFSGSYDLAPRPPPPPSPFSGTEGIYSLFMKPEVKNRVTLSLERKMFTVSSRVKNLVQ